VTKKITIIWKAFGNQPDRNREITAATIELDGFFNVISDDLMLDSIYKVTNLQTELKDFGAGNAEIELWKTIEAVLPVNRTHTSISVGDEIAIDGREYKVADCGFTLIGKEVA